MTARAPQEVALINRAREIMEAIPVFVTSEAECLDATEIDALSDLAVLAYVVGIFARDLHVYYAAAEVAPSERLMKCGWCVAVAGDTIEADAATVAMPTAEAREHTLKCEHNPLVRKVAELERFVAELRADEAMLVAANLDLHKRLG